VNATEKLRRNCAPEYKAPWMRAPFRIREWLCATTGSYLVAVRSDEAAPECPHPEGDVNVQPPSIATRVEVSGAELRAWAGEPWTLCDCGGPSAPCTECHGAGARTRRCFECDEEHECACAQCEGSGTGGCGCGGFSDKTREGRLFGLGINRLLLARALDVVVGDTLTLYVADNRVHIQGDGACATVMTLLVKDNAEAFGHGAAAP
jgi:hypothetical protein